MTYNFNLIQVANWVYLVGLQLKDFREKIDKENISKEEALTTLKAQKRHLELIKDILNRNTTLLGIQKNFIKNLKEIKKQYGIEE